MHRKRTAWLVVIILTVVIKIFSLYPNAVEKYYSGGLYVVISRSLRFLFGWIPFSLGDILYVVAAVYLLGKTLAVIMAVIQKRTGKAFWWNELRRVVFYTLLIYAVFNILWGLNYNRVSMASLVKLEMKPYSTASLQQVVAVLIQRLNANDTAALQTREQYHQSKKLFENAYHSYELAAPAQPYIAYQVTSVKPSLYSHLGDYLGYLGYYNPFTGEAQVNTTIPIFLLPFTACHEMGHQLGYAKENEANFAGYLSAKSSGDAAFRYSVYFELYNYGIRELYSRDSILAIELNKQKPVQVKNDLMELRKFYATYENPVEPYIRRLYSQYLKANEQPAGMQSYNEVMAFLIAYYKKYGADAL